MSERNAESDVVLDTVYDALVEVTSDHLWCEEAAARVVRALREIRERAWDEGYKAAKDAILPTHSYLDKPNPYSVLMSDRETAEDGLPRDRPCCRCGKSPAEGFASVWTAATGERWHCHGDDDESPTCYEGANTVDPDAFGAAGYLLLPSPIPPD